MLFRLILAPIQGAAASTLVLLSLLPALAHSAPNDDVLVDMNQAYKRGDRARLSQLLPQARGNPLEAWAAYWELKARLEDASAQEVQEFLTRYAGSYQEDRLRNDWLLLLGQRRDWTTFAAEHPRYRMGDDREVSCYANLVSFLRGDALDRAALASEVRRQWLALRDADDGCTLAADRLISAGAMDAADAWRKARQAIDANRPGVARRAVEIVAPEASSQVAELQLNARRYLKSRPANTRVRRELVVLALIRLANDDLDFASAQLRRYASELTPEQRNWVWGVLGRQAAMKLQPDADDYFAHVSRDADLNDDTLAWKVRAQLRATVDGQARQHWTQVISAIDAMSKDALRDACWPYWKARALLALNKPGSAEDYEARALLQDIAGPRGFYELLALDELGQKLTLPPAPAPLTEAERAAARQNPMLNRALYAIALGLRPEGVREWNYATNLVNSQGQPGSMSERDLLAAADYACERQVWDRCINTSDRTANSFDVTQRYPMPFRDAVVRRANEIGLDPAYVYGLIRQESRFVMDARSGVGASGLMQVMPATARWTAKKIGLTGFTTDQLNDRDTNIAIGTGYLKLVLDDFGGSMALAAAAYNAGPGRPRAWRNGPVLDAAIWAENVPFTETRNYVKKVLANTTVYAAVLSGQPQSLRERLGQIGPRDAAIPETGKDLP